MKFKPMIALASICLLAYAAMAATPTPTPQDSIAAFTQIWGANGENWGQIAFIAASLSIFFCALAYMIGMGFSQKRLVVWAKDEFMQSLVSLFLLVFVVMFVYGISTMTVDLTAGNSNYRVVDPVSRYCVQDSDCKSQGFICDAGMCVYGCPGGSAGECTAKLGPGYGCEGSGGKNVCTVSCRTLVGDPQAGDSAYHVKCARAILNITESSLETQVEQFVNVNIRLHLVASFFKYADFSPNQATGNNPGPGWPIPAFIAIGDGNKPYAGVTMLTEAMGFVLSFMFAWIASFIAQGFFLRLVQEALFPILLSAGIILRTFFFSRKLGGLLIAIAIGTYTVYPLMYILLGEYTLITNVDIWYDQWNALTCQCGTGGAGYGYLYPADEYKALYCPARFCPVDLIPMILIGIPAGTMGLGLPLTIPGLGAISLSIPLAELEWLFVLIRTAGALFVPGFFIPMIVIVVTISFVKGLSGMLGGDVTLAGLTRLI